MTTLLVQVTMQLAIFLTSMVVTHRRFGTAHNQLVLIRIVLNTAQTHASLAKEKPGAAVPLLVPRKRSKWR
jgi:hypothetical protein